MRMSIPIKLAAVLFVASVVPLVTAITFAYYDSAIQLRQLVQHDANEQAEASARYIRLVLDALAAQSRQIAHNPAAIDFLRKHNEEPPAAPDANEGWSAISEYDEPLRSILHNDVTTLMQSFRQQNENSKALLLLAPSGRALAAASKPQMLYWSTAPWWRAALKHHSEPVVLIEKNAAAAFDVVICVGIHDTDARLLGIARITFDAACLLSFSKDAMHGRDSDTDIYYGGELALSIRKASNTATPGGASTMTGESRVPLPGGPGHLLVVVRKDTASRPSRIAGRINLLVIFAAASIGFFFLIGYYMSHRNIVLPIKRLIKGARKLADGDLSHRINPHHSQPAVSGPAPGGDELDDLAREFNRMADALMKNQETLEEIVQLRTREYAEENRKAVEARTKLEEAMIKLRDTQANMIQAEKLASLGQLVAGVAHEINNPLSFILNNLSVIERDYRAIIGILLQYRKLKKAMNLDTPELKKVEERENELDIDYLERSVDRIFSSTMNGLNRVKTIVSDLKDFSRPDNLEAEDLDIEHSLDTTLELVGYHLVSKGIHVVREYDKVPLVRSYPGRLNQVFLNLIVNAIQAMGNGGTITLRTHTREDHVVVQVSDTGCGIAPEHLSKIFDPFFTTKKQGDGTGLGLSVSYGIVREHNGTIQVRSLPGQGATFSVSLPLKAMETNE